MTIKRIVEEIDIIKENPTATRHIPTVKKSPPKECLRYFNIILRLVPINFPFKNAKEFDFHHYLNIF